MMEPDDMGKNYVYKASPLAVVYACILCHTVFFFTGLSVCYGQKEVRIERITVDQGLSQSSISSITQDRYGYLWVATLDGLNRYDGREFKIYKHANDDTTSLFRNHVANLLLDREQTLWVVHEGVIA